MKRLKYIIFIGLVFSLSYYPMIAKKKKVDYSVSLTTSAGYDNNILGYSDKYKTRFENGEDPGRFHINTFDDIIVSEKLRLRLGYKFWNKYKTNVYFNFAFNYYTQNDIKNRLSGEVSIRQQVSPKIILSAGYGIIPKFYIRHYRDFDYAYLYGFTPESFKEFTFSKEYVFFNTQYNFDKKWRFDLQAGFANYVYNKEFTEFDSRDYSIDLSSEYKYSTKLKFMAGYKFLFSDARGYELPELYPNTNMHSQASFYEHQLSIGARYYLPRLMKKKNYLRTNVSYSRAIFTTDLPPELDQLHSGRVDNEIRANLYYNFELNENINFGLNYNFNFRDALSSSDINKTVIADEKNYSKHFVALEFTYKFNNL